MPVLEIQTAIRAPIERVFDLCRSVDAHVATAGPTGERAVAGTTSGLLELGDDVTWSARHLGLRWRLTSRIVAMGRPRHFRDAMVAGPFRRFDHDHRFVERAGVTEVTDVFDFTSPLGFLGRIADALVVERHLRRFLTARMNGIRHIAESDAWSRFLPPDAEQKPAVSPLRAAP